MRVNVRGEGFLAETTRIACEGVGHTLVTGNAPTDVLWICHHLETPDTTEFLARLAGDPWLRYPHPHTPILVSSPVPVGTIASLERRYPGQTFAYSPENIRRTQPLVDFRTQTRIVIGRRTYQNDALWEQLLSSFTTRLIWTDPETAEMAKHALNTYLALSIVFTNEIARIAAKVGANADTIADTLLTERRISPRAPLRPGPPYDPMGHLARDLTVLAQIAQTHGVYVPVLDKIRHSNEEGELWHSARSSQALQASSVSTSCADWWLTNGQW